MIPKTISSYVISTYSFIFTSSIDSLLRVGYIGSNEAVAIPSFEQNLLINLCSEAEITFQNEPNLLRIHGDTIVVGDIHGSFHDLLRIIKFSQEKRSKVLFLGDYVDRGNFSIECITLLLALKTMYPDTYYLIRGNHEFDSMCSQYGFKDEILNYHNPKIPKKPANRTQISRNHSHFTEDTHYDFFENYKNEHCYKYSEELYSAFVRAFSFLPIAAVINNETFCIHGGLSPKLELVGDIETQIVRPVVDFEENVLLTDVLWSDPAHSPNCPFVKNTRGRGYLFNTEAVNNFLKRNSLKRIIRAHECVEDGALKNFGDKLMTVFSASSYDMFTNNKSAVIQFFESESKFKIMTFVPLPRLQKSEAIYYKVQPLANSDNNSNNNQICFSFAHHNLLKPIPRNKQCLKASSLNFTPVRTSGTTNLVPNRGPKFTTNRRQSFDFIIKKKNNPHTNTNHMNSDNDEQINLQRNSQHLPASLFSFADPNFVSE